MNIHVVKVLNVRNVSAFHYGDQLKQLFSIYGGVEEYVSFNLSIINGFQYNALLSCDSNVEF